MKVHVRYGGKSETLYGEEWGIRRETSDQAIKEIVSGIYEIPPGALRDLVVDRNPDGIVVRPPAVFG